MQKVARTHQAIMAAVEWQAHVVLPPASLVDVLTRPAAPGASTLQREVEVEEELDDHRLRRQV